MKKEAIRAAEGPRESIHCSAAQPQIVDTCHHTFGLFKVFKDIACLEAPFEKPSDWKCWMIFFLRAEGTTCLIHDQVEAEGHFFTAETVDD